MSTAFPDLSHTPAHYGLFLDLTNYQELIDSTHASEAEFKSEVVIRVGDNTAYMTFDEFFKKLGIAPIRDQFRELQKLGAGAIAVQRDRSKYPYVLRDESTKNSEAK